MMKRELEELIGILCYKGWGFRMLKRVESDNKYVIGVVLGNEILECDVDDEKGLKALAFDVVNFNRDEFEVCEITGPLGSLFNNCVIAEHDIEVMGVDDFEYMYNFRNSDAKWVIQIELKDAVYIVPYDNEEVIDAINSRLTKHPSIVKYNGVEILVDSEVGTVTYKVRIGCKFIAFSSLDDTKKFIENNVKESE